jgi:hypothetical protein
LAEHADGVATQDQLDVIIAIPTADEALCEIVRALNVIKPVDGFPAIRSDVELVPVKVGL